MTAHLRTCFLPSSGEIRTTWPQGHALCSLAGILGRRLCEDKPNTWNDMEWPLDRQMWKKYLKIRKD